MQKLKSLAGIAQSPFTVLVRQANCAVPTHAVRVLACQAKPKDSSHYLFGQNLRRTMENVKISVLERILARLHVFLSRIV